MISSNIQSCAHIFFEVNIFRGNILLVRVRYWPPPSERPHVGIVAYVWIIYMYVKIGSKTWFRHCVKTRNKCRHTHIILHRRYYRSLILDYIYKSFLHFDIYLGSMLTVLHRPLIFVMFILVVVRVSFKVLDSLSCV